MWVLISICISYLLQTDQILYHQHYRYYYYFKMYLFFERESVCRVRYRGKGRERLLKPTPNSQQLPVLGIPTQDLISGP